MLRVLRTKDDGQHEAGTIALANGELKFTANQGFEQTMESVRNHAC